MQINYQPYYNLETYILNDVRDRFIEKGFLNAFDFFCIIIWKANRAKSKIANRLLKLNKDKSEPDLEWEVKKLTSSIYLAETPEAKLKILIGKEYGFRLPMASAILGMLYPETFTIYDVRVCETLTEYKGLDNTDNVEKKCIGYFNYLAAVKDIEPTNLSLRDKDRFLWAKSFYEQLNSDIYNQFK